MAFQNSFPAPTIAILDKSEISICHLQRKTYAVRVLFVLLNVILQLGETIINGSDTLMGIFTVRFCDCQFPLAFLSRTETSLLKSVSTKYITVKTLYNYRIIMSCNSDQKIMFIIRETIKH